MSRRTRQPPQKPQQDHADQLLFFDVGTPAQRQATNKEIEEIIEARIDIVMRSQHRGCAPRICDFDWQAFRQEVWLGAFRRVSEKYVHNRGPRKLWDFVGGALLFSLRDLQRKSVHENKRYDPNQNRPLIDYIERGE